MKNLMTMGFMIDKVTVNEGAAKSLISSLLTPLNNILLWVAPFAGAFACLVILITWFFKDEEEKERHKPFRMIKKVLIVMIVAESIMAILKIFGLNA